MARSVESSGMADSKKKDENQTEGIVNEHGALAELKSSHKEAAKTKPSKSEDFEGFKSDAAF